MKRLLKQKTATTVMIGEFIDDNDGKTSRGDLTISASEIFLSKNGSAYIAKNDSGSPLPDSLFTGWYKCSLNATDTSASGTLTLAIHTSGALPIWKSWEIVPSNVYDSILGNDLLDTNIDDVLNTTVEGIYNVQDILQGSSAALVGKLSGGGTNQLVFRDLEDTKNRLILDVDTSGNRTSSSLVKDI